MRIDAVVFDLDGTLVDSAPDLHAAANAMLRELGREQLALEVVISFVGNGVRKLVERSLKATGGVPDEAESLAALALFERHYSEHSADLTRTYPGVPEALAGLRRSGRKLAICTNKPHELAVDVVRRLGLNHFVELTVGGGLLPQLKPDPAPLIHCLAQLGVAPAGALFVGDSETDEATAAAAGIPFALFAGGYRGKPVEAFDAAFVFASFDRLGDMLDDGIGHRDGGS